MKLIILLLLPFISLSQTPDTSGFVDWSVKKVRRPSATEISVVMVGKVEKGYSIGPIEHMDLGMYSLDESPTSMYFTADSNWTVDVMHSGPAILTHQNKYRYHSRYYSEIVERRYPVERKVDTVIRGRRRQIMITDSNGYKYGKVTTTFVNRKTKEYNASIQLYGKIIMKRDLKFLPTQLQALKANSQTLPAPDKYQESRREQRRRMKAGEKAAKIYRLPYPRRILCHFKYEINNHIYTYVMGIPVPRKVGRTLK